MILIDEDKITIFILWFKAQSINVPKNKKVGPNTTHVNFEIEKTLTCIFFVVRPSRGLFSTF